MSNQYDSIRHTKCLYILCNWNRFLLIGFRILATSKDYVKINFLPQYQLVEFNKSTSSTDKSVTSPAGGKIKKHTLPSNADNGADKGNSSSEENPSVHRST